MPPIVLSIVTMLQLSAKFEPIAASVYAEARSVFQRLFSGGFFTAKQQMDLMDWCDAHQAATLAGDIPPELVVEPNPT